MSFEAASVLFAKSFRLTSHLIMTVDANPLRNMQAHSELHYNKPDGHAKEKDFLLGVTLRNKQYLTSNCSTYCSFTANLLPLKMSAVLPEIYIYCPETLFSCYCVFFLFSSRAAAKGKAIKEARGKTTDGECCQGL